MQALKTLKKRERALILQSLVNWLQCGILAIVSHHEYEPLPSNICLVVFRMFKSQANDKLSVEMLLLLNSTTVLRLSVSHVMRYLQCQ